LDATGLGIVQLDARGRIVAANDRARDLLRTGDTLFDQGGFLFAQVQADDEAFQAMLTRALPPFGDRGEGGSMTIKRPAPLPPLVVHVNPLHPRDVWSRGWPVAALVLLAEPARGAGIDPDLAQAVLGLTPTESRVAAMLAEGMSVNEIATALGREASTIRFHVKRIFARHGLNRQAELVRLVLSLAGAANRQR
ncbi:MAG: helix-turn-helix transcriptional regulator, partial [Rhodospirillaceae bacterium]|nr:helix-turn-helix transcriptional regulator [Rhodospirillaceae bacterium]